MKKLIAMIGAVAMAFGLYADFPDTGMISGAGFDTTDGTESGYSWTTAGALEAGALDTTFWTGATDKAVVVAGSPTESGDENQPVNYYNDASREYDGVLSIKTTLGTPVAQRVKSTTIGGAHDLAVDGGLYFDAMIKPTVFDYTDDLAALIAAQTDAKIGVYAQMSEDETKTNLFVYAKGATGATAWETTTAIDDSAWIRLTIKMIANIGTGKNPGFVVFVNGTAVECLAAKMDPAGLTASAQEWNKTGSLFEGLINSTEITDVAFDGQGLVDEIAFTTTVPGDWAKDTEFATITWDATKVATIKIDGESVENTGSFQVKVTDGPFAIAWTGAGNWMDGNKDFAPEKDGDTLNVTEGLAEAVATFAGKKYAKFNTEDDVEGAVNAANEATEDGELVLLANAGAIEINNENEGVKILIDLKGYDCGEINVQMGEVTLTNSLETIATVAAITSANDGTLTVTDAAIKVDGLVTGDDDCLYLNGGAYLASANELDELNKYKPEDAEFIEVEGYYVLHEVTSFTVEVPAAKANTKLEVTIDDDPAGITNGTYTVAKASTLKAVYTADTGYELDDEGEFEVTFETKDTVVIDAPTAHLITVDFTVAEIQNATLLAVSNGTEAVVADEDGKYTVPTNATVVLYYAPAEGYKLDQTTAEVTIDTADQVVNVSSTIKPAQYIAQMGSEKYTSLNDAWTAFKAAKVAATITVLADAEIGVQKWSGEIADLTLDLNGKKLTAVDTDSKYVFQFLKGTNTITVKNGYIDTVAHTDGDDTLATVFQNYANLVVEDLHIDAANFGKNKYSDEAGNIFAVMFGNVQIKGNTSITNNNGYALTIGNHAGDSKYVQSGRTVTLDTEGTLGGGFRFCGGQVTYVNCGFSEDAKFLYGSAWTSDGSKTNANEYSIYEDGDLVNFPFVARVGIAPVLPTKEENLWYKYCGEFSLTLNAAIEAAKEGDEVAVFKNVTQDTVTIKSGTATFAVATNTTLTANEAFTLNGAKVVLAEGGTLVVPTALDKVADFVAPATGKEIKVAGESPYTYTVGTIQVTATFKDGETETKVVGDYGFTPEAPEAKGKDGYTFEKWNPAVAAITADTTFTAVYTANVYTVTFYGDDQKTNTLATQQVEYNGYVTEVPAPTREGFEFQGWNADTNVAITAATDFWATWKAVQSGPVIDPTHDTAEIKVEGDKATITLKGDSTEAYVIGGMDLNEVDVPVNLKAIRGVKAEAVKVKVGEYDITAAFTIAANSSTGCVDVNLSEDPAATVTIGTETIKVTPTIGENVEASEVKITDGEIAVQAIPGLTYELIRSTKLGDESTEAVADTVKAETTKVELTDKIEGTKPAAAFYQIKVEAK